VPKGYRLHLEAGCQLDFQQGAFIWSASPVTANGSQEEPVLIQSKDGSGRGFHVMAPEGENLLSYVYFDGLNTLDVPERRLTGAVTFYEAQVDLQHCVFRNNRCEDGLNLIRSEFKMNYCVFANTFGDAFDSDFCKGRLKGCRFTNCGNDGLDISGSVVLVEDCYFDTMGDKGISVGEDSDATILSAYITNAPIAIAVKDLSTAVISSITLKNCRQGFVVFQKKAEYGDGHIVVENYKAEGVVKLYHGAEGNIILPE
jgi:Right handed beta helix region